MRSKIRVRTDYSKWHLWFAWHPVLVGPDFGRQWVWWETIERRVESSLYDSFTYYRLPLPPENTP